MTKQSEGKLLPHSDLRMGVSSGGTRRLRREMKLGSCSVRYLYRAGHFKAAAFQEGTCNMG